MTMRRFSIWVAVLGCLSILSAQTAPEDRATLLALDPFFREVDRWQKRAMAREHFQDRYDMDPATLAEVTKAAAAYIQAVAELGPGAESQKRKEALIRQALDSLDLTIGPAQLRYIIYYVRFHMYFRPGRG